MSNSPTLSQTDTVIGSAPPLPHPRAFGLSLAAGFALLFLAAYGGANFVSAWVPWRIRPGLPCEASLPFVPAFALVYLSLPLLLLWCAWRLDWVAQWRLVCRLCCQLLLACVCFVLLPVATDFPPRVVNNGWAPWLTLATTLSMAHNHLPSLHTAFALSGALALQAYLGPVGRLLAWFWAALVVASTVLIHEHHLLDLLAGAVLVWLVHRHILPASAPPPALAAVRLRWLLLVNQCAFARRHRRYAWISLLLALQCLRRPQAGRLMLCGYVFLQAVDDTMDGDRPAVLPPDTLASRLQIAWQSACFQPQGATDAAADYLCLAQAFYQGLAHTAAPARARAEVAQLLAVMRDDYRRAQQHLLWSAAALSAQHRRTFTLSLNLLLAALGSPLRAEKHAPELVDALGWCSTMRDLNDDVAAGIINIPAEVWQQLPVPPSPKSGEGWQQPLLRQWMADEKRQAQTLLAAFAQRPLPATDPGSRVLRLFARSVANFARRLPD